MMKFALLLMSALCLQAQLPVPLATAANFAVLAGSTVTNTGASLVSGNLGLSPGTSVTGFPPGTVTNGTQHVADAVAAQAESDVTTAYGNASTRPCPGPPMPGDIGGTVITPGVYCNSTSVGITGTVTLSGNASSVFIFQIGSTLTTAAGNSVVLLSGGVLPSNVFWQVGSSATLGTNTTFNGTIMAQDSITVNTGAALYGRALARTGAVTLADNAVEDPSETPGGGPGTPAPPSLILVMLALVLTAAYVKRERLVRPFSRS